MTGDEALRTAARDMVRKRVRVRAGDDEVFGVLSAVTPGDDLLVADPGGRETRVPLRAVSSIGVAQYKCAECGARTNTRYDRDRCADCYREWAKQQPVPSETCEDCGAARAVYSPKSKVWRCPQCHAKHRSFSGSTVEAAALTATCRSDDKESPRHDWRRVKSQYVCKVCHVKVFGRPASLGSE